MAVPHGASDSDGASSSAFTAPGAGLVLGDGLLPQSAQWLGVGSASGQASGQLPLIPEEQVEAVDPVEGQEEEDEEYREELDEE